MATQRDLERAEKRLARTQALASRQGEELESVKNRLELEHEMVGMLPKGVDPEVRQGIAILLGGLIPGIANQATGIPEPIIPAAELGLGLVGQLVVDLSPDWNEAAVGITEGGGAVTA